MKILRSYEKVWKMEKKLYSIERIQLPVPVKFITIGYVAACVLIMVILSRLPFLRWIHPIIRYVVMPYFMAKFLEKKKLDGKNPIRFFIDYIKFLFQRGTPIQFFRPVIKQAKKTKLEWVCGTRTML